MRFPAEPGLLDSLAGGSRALRLRQGRMWGYPQYGINIYGLTLNKDHFKEAGLNPEKPPRT